jgi:transposase InsO family protein
LRRGIEVGRDRVARLMRQQGMAGVIRGRRHTTTIPDDSVAARARDLVDRNFTATGPNQLWVADFTYLRQRGGFLYLAFILGCVI